MKPLRKKTVESESDIQTRLIRALTLGGWYCVHTHGNMYQAGFPDLFCCNRRLGTRWIECKKPVGYRFTQAQMDVFTIFASKNIGIWVLTGYSDYECNKLMKPSNWYTYLKGVTLTGSVKRIPKAGPEGVIQDAIIAKLTEEGWFCLETYGSIYQSGLPDIYCCHARYGARWIECKNPAGYRFTPAQVAVFPSLAAQQVGIWILTAATQSECDKLFGPPNWHIYMWH